MTIQQDTENKFKEAIEKGEVSTLEKLLETSPDLLDLKFDNKFDIIFYACQYGHVKVLELFLSKLPDYVLNLEQDPNESNALHIACQYGHINLINYLLSIANKRLCEQTNREFNTSNRARLNIAIIEKLIKPLKSENKKYIKNLIAQYKKDPQFYTAEQIQYFIYKNLNLSDTKGKEGNTPLHCACMNGQLEVVKCLLNNNPDSLFNQNKRGTTAFHLACRYGQSEVIQYLLNNYSKKLFEYDNRQGINNTAIYHAIGSAVEKRNMKPLELLNDDSNFSKANHRGEKIIHLAAYFGDKSTVKYCVKNLRLNPADRDRNKCNAVDYAKKK